MFVDRDWLEQELRSGKSLEQIGREVGRDGSTVAYWAKKHGLVSPRAAKFARRGPPDRQLVETLCERGATLSEIAVAVDRSIRTVCYWLDKWEIERGEARRS